MRRQTPQIRLFSPTLPGPSAREAAAGWSRAEIPPDRAIIRPISVLRNPASSKNRLAKPISAAKPIQ